MKSRGAALSLSALVAVASMFMATRAGAEDRLDTSPAKTTYAPSIEPSIVAATLATMPLQLAPPTTIAGVDPGASTVVVGVTPVAFAWRGAEITASAGVMRDVSGAGAAWAHATLTRDIGRLRLATSLHATHVLAAGRDPLDTMVTLGATYEVSGPLRAGVEYVAQDVEAGFDNDAEGGMRQFIGPIVAIDLPKRFSLVAGPALSLAPAIVPGTGPVVGRLGVSYAF